MRRGLVVGKSTTLWIAIGALLLGYALGQAGSSVPAGAAGAFRGAEHATPAAAVCTPAPSATSTPTPAPTATATPVPPAAAGQPVPYGDGWTVVVTGLSLVPTVDQSTAEGMFAVVGLSVTNDASAARSFDFWSLRLVNASGRIFEPAIAPTVLANTRHPYVAFDPGIARDVALVFDVAADAGEVFILESVVDPTFRAQVTLTRLG